MTPLSFTSPAIHSESCYPLVWSHTLGFLSFCSDWHHSLHLLCFPHKLDLQSWHQAQTSIQCPSGRLLARCQLLFWILTPSSLYFLITDSSLILDSSGAVVFELIYIHIFFFSFISAIICWIIEKAREFQKNIYFCFIDYAKACDCVDHTRLENSSRDGNTRPPDLPLEKFVCRSGSNS